jgi:hypothetical protein
MVVYRATNHDIDIHCICSGIVGIVFCLAPKASKTQKKSVTHASVSEGITMIDSGFTFRVSTAPHKDRAGQIDGISLPDRAFGQS